MKFAAVCFLIVSSIATLAQAQEFCGTVQHNGPELLFLHQRGPDEFKSSIVRARSEIREELSQLVGFREVCVEAIPAGNFLDVTEIVSRSE